MSSRPATRGAVVAQVLRAPAAFDAPPLRGRRAARRWLRHHERKLSDAGYRRASKRYHLFLAYNAAAKRKVPKRDEPHIRCSANQNRVSAG